ncbi:MAG: hypothetical protein FJ294_03305 [Planctomycetes bacterium]|nr:hypothetical protein [Planctomycetota bacterium]
MTPYHPFTLACLLFATPALAQQTFPLDPAGNDAASGGLRYTLAHERVDDLVGSATAVLSGVLLPDGRMVDLDLRRIEHERMGFRFHVNGVPRTDLLDGLDLTIWKGSIAGLPGSDAMLSFSHVGAQGWIQTGSGLVHLITRPAANGDWQSGDALLVEESELNARGMALANDCAVLPTPGSSVTPVPQPSTPGVSQLLGGGCALRECKVSIESDYQYYTRFNNTSAQAAYTTTLWSFISDRYETQASTILTFPYVGFYSTASDPWTTPDAPGTSSAMLTEFRNAWVGNIPNGGRVGHFMSGAALGGGVAWLDVLCSNSYNFAVSGNLNGTISFPIQQQPNNWDFIVCAHELGHNFNARHTHDYCPPLDQCPPSQYFGSCQTAQVCSNQGTVMSYCHLCSGGTANITTYFHPGSATDMTNAANACLAIYAGISGTELTLVAPLQATPVTATTSGTPIGSVRLRWRASPAMPWATVDMTSNGNGTHSGLLPAFLCTETPQWYYEFDEQTCGAMSYPAGAPATPLSAQVGSLATTFSDTFQSDLGWTTAIVGATTGQWERGVPVNDPSWAYDPATDGDGSGSCWLTQNANGNTDVDGGSVQLFSPSLDLSIPNARIDYFYYLRITVADGVDALTFDVSSSGLAGPWTQIARHTTDSNAWRSGSITGASIAALGVTLGANMRIRVTANDSGTASIVEAGLDGFSISGQSCTSGIGFAYCTSSANSSGGAALISATGSASIAANDLVLSAAPVPNGSAGLFLFGSSASQTPFGNGTKCVASPVRRLGISNAVGTTLSDAVNNAQAPAAGVLVSGSTWFFQAWFRDTAAGGSNTNLSNGLRVTFVP